MSNTRLESALALIKKGFCVFPLETARTNKFGEVVCTCGASKCEGKHPRISFTKYATSLPSDVEYWWKRWPDAEVGINLGKSYCWVLDIDPRHDGDKTLRDVLKTYGELPPTLTCNTGGGGTHYYFNNFSRAVKSSKNNLFQGIDYKSGNAYVVGPGSGHFSNHMYEWADETAQIMDAPDWLLNIIQINERSDKTYAPKKSLTPAEYAKYRIEKKEKEFAIERLLSPAQFHNLRDEGKRLMGFHPTHPTNDGPREFTIDREYNRWKCWHHGSKGGCLELAAVLSGICKCEEFAPPKDPIGITINPLSSVKFRKTLQACATLGIPQSEIDKLVPPLPITPEQKRECKQSAAIMSKAITSDNDNKDPFFASVKRRRKSQW